VQRVEDAAVLRVRGFHERLERREPLRLLAGAGGERSDDHDLRHAMLLLGTGRRIVRPTRGRRVSG